MRNFVFSARETHRPVKIDATFLLDAGTHHLRQQIPELHDITYTVSEATDLVGTPIRLKIKGATYDQFHAVAQRIRKMKGYAKGYIKRRPGQNYE